MAPIWQWGIDVIVFIQQIRSPFSDAFFFFISFFGTHVFYIILLPFLYWCVDKKYAYGIFIIFLISSWSNAVAKDLLLHPRPYNLNEAVKIGKTSGYGIPSGHAQQSLVVGVSLSLWLKNRFFTYFSVAAILLIALSRVYLGVHFPTDIFGGWLLGSIILFILWPFSDRIVIFLSGFSPYVLSAVSVIIPALLSLILASKWSVMSMGALSGVCAGLIIEKKYLNFQETKNLKAAVPRYITGAAILMLIFSVDNILSGMKVPYYLIMVFVHSWILGIWVSAGAPWLFKKCGI